MVTNMPTSLPTGYFQLPLWIIIAGWSLIIALIGYIWHSQSKRIEKLEHNEEEGLKAGINDPAWKKQDERISDLEKEELRALRKQSDDPILTFQKHMILCNSITASFKEYVGQRMDSFEKAFNEFKFEIQQDTKELKDSDSKIWDRLDEFVRNGGKKTEK
jgi:hypothetical protein